MPPRDRYSNYRGDPRYQIWDQISRQDPTRDTPRVGFLEHDEISRYYEEQLGLDAKNRRQFWADYNLYLVSNRTNYPRNGGIDGNDNPFWQRWNIDPSSFNWRAWRQAMGYPEGGRR